MFTNVSYKSINWLKNKTKEGGAMDEVLSKIKGVEMALNIISKKYGRMWGMLRHYHSLKIDSKE